VLDWKRMLDWDLNRIGGYFENSLSCAMAMTLHI
jgi:hypothetical protein